jgi:membrane protein YdbS with pleckstrin-like domain
MHFNYVCDQGWPTPVQRSRNIVRPIGVDLSAEHAAAIISNTLRPPRLELPMTTAQAPPYTGAHPLPVTVMASYVEGALVKDERIVHIGHISCWSLFHLIALGILLLPAFGLGLIFLGKAYMRYKTTELAITTKRVIVKFGFIRRSTVEININKVESIQVDQEILGRLFNFGTLIIAGAGNPQAPITGISQPMEFRRAFIQAQDQARSVA